jgi:hypothetical protein
MKKEISLIIGLGCFLITIDAEAMLNRLPRAQMPKFPPKIQARSFSSNRYQANMNRIQNIDEQLKRVQEERQQLITTNKNRKPSWFKRTFSLVGIPERLINESDIEINLLKQKIDLLEQQLKACNEALPQRDTAGRFKQQKKPAVPGLSEKYWNPTTEKE